MTNEEKSEKPINPMTNQITTGSIISFRYKGNRFVKGLVTFIDNKNVVLILHTDYIGKNEEWFEGEKKIFNLKEMKKINVRKTKKKIIKQEPCLMQSAFQLDNGKKIIIYSSCWTGVSSFECDENWKPFPKPFATCSVEEVKCSFTEYHQRIRSLHGDEKLVKEHSTVLSHD